MRRRRKNGETITEALERLMPKGDEYRTVYFLRQRKGAPVLHRIFQFAREKGLPVRVPHHTVSWAAILGEADLASGGILVLDDFWQFSRGAIDELRKHVSAPLYQRPLLIVMLDEDTLPDDAYTDIGTRLGYGVVPTRVMEVYRVDERYELEPVGTRAPRADVQQALAVINQHRRRIGQRALDPAAVGWTDEDVIIEAARIGRLSNPRRVGQLRRRLLA